MTDPRDLCVSGFGAIVLLLTGLTGCAWLGLPTVRGCWVASAKPEPFVPVQRVQRLIILGDLGANFEQRNVTLARALQRFLSVTPEASTATQVLLLGDNFYPRGLVGTHGRCDPQQATPHAIQQQLEEVLEPFAFLRDMHIPVTAIAGNHDHGCGTMALENQANPDRFLPPHQHWGALWNFHYGLPEAVTFADTQVRLLLVDSEMVLRSRQFLQASVQHLERLLTEGEGRYRWQLLAAHHPLWTVGEHDGAFPAGIRKPLTFALFPVHFFAAAGFGPFVDLSQEAYSFRYMRYRRAVEHVLRRHPGSVNLLLSGHDHSLQLLKPKEAGLPFQLIVGSGAYCSPVRRSSEATFAAAKHGFAVLDFSSDLFSVAFYGTTPCADKEVCPKGTPEAYLLYQAVFRQVGPVEEFTAERVF